MNWPRNIPFALAWAVGGLLVLLPVTVFAADRLLPFGRAATLFWGSLPVGAVAGWLHRDWGVGLLTVVAVVLLGIIANMALFVGGLQFVPGP